MSTPLSEQYEQQARAEASAPVPVLLKLTRAVVWVVYVVIVVKVLLLLVAFVLRLLGASTDTSFVRWVYRSADRSMEPFRGIFPSREVGEVSVLDSSLLFAVIAYLVVALIVDLALRWLADRVARQEGRVQSLHDAAREAAIHEYEVARRLEAQRLASERLAPPPSPPSPPPSGS